jgi:hypothetical protein
MTDTTSRGEHTPPTAESIADRLRLMPAGSHAIVGVEFVEGGNGSWFNAYWDGSTVWAMQGPDDRRPWPPELPPVKSWGAIYTEAGATAWTP